MSRNGKRDIGLPADRGCIWPREAGLLSKAIEWRRQLDVGEVPNQASIAGREGLTRARVTQVLGLLRLAPEIQEHILALPETVGRPAISERALRSVMQLGKKQQARALVDISSR